MEQSQNKMLRLFSYYGKRPPVRPSYWNLKQQKLMTDNVQRQRIMFRIKSRSRALKSSSQTNSSGMSKNSPSINNMLFTSSFYKKLDSDNEDFSSKPSLRLFLTIFRIYSGRISVEQGVPIPFLLTLFSLQDLEKEEDVQVRWLVAERESYLP